jgi:hypothetical protein
LTVLGRGNREEGVSEMGAGTKTLIAIALSAGVRPYDLSAELGFKVIYR